MTVEFYLETTAAATTKDEISALTPTADEISTTSEIETTTKFNTNSANSIQNEDEINSLDENLRGKVL